ncbi:MAG: hypothetical protein GHCLOJNM_02060 [bacterium]|nr:hypothetical protein [bacterium]
MAESSSTRARIEAIQITLYRTLKLRGYEPIETIVSTLRRYITDNFTLPPLPPVNSPSEV